MTVGERYGLPAALFAVKCLVAAALAGKGPAPPGKGAGAAGKGLGQAQKRAWPGQLSFFLGNQIRETMCLE